MKGRHLNLSKLTCSLICDPILLACLIVGLWGHWFVIAFWFLFGIAGAIKLNLYETKIFSQEVWTPQKHLYIWMDAITFGVIFFFIPLDIYGVYLGKIKTS